MESLCYTKAKLEDEVYFIKEEKITLKEHFKSTIEDLKASQLKRKKFKSEFNNALRQKNKMACDINNANSILRNKITEIKILHKK